MGLADRMKRYELTSRSFLTRRTPVIIRVDGKAFHTLTRGCGKPFDKKIMDSMVGAAYSLSKEMQGFKAAYIQSDEATFLLTDYDDITTEAWFDYNVNKLASISASMMSVFFTMKMEKLAFFDSRAFNVPKDDVVNCFLWRSQDWKRNSLQMYARSLFSYKELHNKNTEDMHNMLHEIGKNWSTDLTDRQKNGTFIVGGEMFYNILPTYDSINELLVDYI